MVTMSLPRARGKFAIIVSLYAPTLTKPEDTKTKFYNDLHSIPNAVANADKLIILGDFNLRVGLYTSILEGVIGKHGVGQVQQ